MRWHLTGLSALGLAAILGIGTASIDTLAAEPSTGPALPPAPYKPLPEGAQVNYDNWWFSVLRNDDYSADVMINGQRPVSQYGHFGRSGTWANSKMTVPAVKWQAQLDDDAKSAFRRLWPLNT